MSPRQQRAAQLLGRGWQHGHVADEVGVTAKSVQRWLHRDDFVELVRQAREAVLEETPTARATLQSALGATNARGEPDWKIRVAAAQTLVGSKSGRPAEEEVRETRIYLPPEREGDDAG